MEKMALFRRETVLEDSTTIRILEEQKLAVSVAECDLEHIDAVVERMDRDLYSPAYWETYNKNRIVIGI